MESRASPVDNRSPNLPAISRRSCDQCRARKIGCDRGKPCSNCISARVDCTHSRVAPKQTTARQRVLVSEQYERKIDDISRDVSSIKSLLAGLNLGRVATQSPGRENHSTIRQLGLVEANGLPEPNDAPLAAPLPRWDYSAHIIGFVRSIVQDSGLAPTNNEWKNTLSSLKGLANALEHPRPTQALPIAGLSENLPAPPLEAVLGILRWANAHSNDLRIIWICRFLPLNIFQEICTRVYFGVKDHTEAEFIIANAFLTYVFAEYAVVHGEAKCREYCQFYRENVGSALSKLSLLLPASMELVAALALGALYMVEESRASQAWILISTAMSLCQTLGYHRLDSSEARDTETHTQLFWVVYAYEKGMSLRLGRCSGIRDSDITLPTQSCQHRSIRLGRIQGKAYDQLYSSQGLATSIDTRCDAANSFAHELQSIIDETRGDLAQALTLNGGMEDDPMRVIYLHCDLVCESALMSMVLRALPRSRDTDAHQCCITVARNTLDLHDQCMKLVNGCKDPLLIRRYINWAVLHTPFFPFSIIFTHAIRHASVEDLDRLDRFAASFKPETSDQEPTTHPHRLYALLSKTARLHVTSLPNQPHDDGSSLSDLTMADSEIADITGEIDGEVADLGPNAEYDPSLDIGEWFHSNQQFMQLLHEDLLY